MITKEVVINNQVGLHARPATFFIQKANEFKSSIWVEKEERRVNAKSLLGVLSLGIVKGTAITIIADGSDEEEAIATLAELIESDFSESSATLAEACVQCTRLFFSCTVRHISQFRTRWKASARAL